MSTNARGSQQTIPPTIYAELLHHLSITRSSLSPEEAVTRALTDWMVAQRRATTPLRGYQWKSLFLPEGTHVRMQGRGLWHMAEVRGDQLMFQGRVVSPRQMTLVVAGEGRNAWRETWVRRPGERNWMAAERLRNELRHASPSAPEPSPMESMQTAARSMNEALRSALVLVNHASLSAQNTTERRLPKHRRLEDTLTDE